MTAQFNGSLDQLKSQLSSLEGKWDCTQQNRVMLRANDGVMNWHPSTGKISFQGKKEGKQWIEIEVKELLSSVKQSELTQRIGKLIAVISEGMFEREEIISVALLGALCGQNTFLYGPPGTAKSLISRRIACAFKQPAYFEYLMNRFSTPEDVFGPISIKALKEDQYTRKTDRYLPKAEFAFLDEIWKSSPAILNTLLTLINERIFRNGEEIEKAPLKALIAASNETPDENQGLEALYDRFIVRLMVGPIVHSDNFDQLLNGRPVNADTKVADALAVEQQEWAKWQQQLHEVDLSNETMTIIHLIREALLAQDAERKVYVSDRRWQRAAMLMKASAFFNGRKETNHSDALLLSHCLWTTEDNRETVKSIVDQAVKDTGFDSEINLADLDSKKEKLDIEINEELFFSKDIYDTENIEGRDYFKTVVQTYSHSSREETLYIDFNYMKSNDTFKPVDRSGNEIDKVTCNFDGQGTCHIAFNRNYHSSNNTSYKPEVLFHKGDKKTEVNNRLVESLVKSVSELKMQLATLLGEVEKKRVDYEVKLESLFVPAKQSQIAIHGITEQIEGLKLRIKDCERLEALCGK
ncbi:AAA family ATPase [Neptunomonas sp.]|uniref:AAA family ATPase n=1 Tax=Neptunomonas TaxID=75687 RepID=UPI0035112D21